MSVDRAELAACLAVLARLDDADLDDAVRQELERAVVAASRGVKKRAKARRSARTREADRALLAKATRFHTEIPDPTPADAATPVDPAPGNSALIRARHCYVCKSAYRQVDVDYHLMCPPCA
ncbi:MAG TPA: SDR family NAD(P)-dependent oxidoreductase, partial [Micromonospora sp.]|nr:SDR family NAD(P)-dependent oxidoreductase [Micromonospora sp.]